MNSTEVGVFFVDARDHDYNEMVGQLSQDCVERLARITHPRRREQFVLGRFLLRQALAHLYGPISETWRLDAAFGKPRLIGAGAPEFSLTHSRELVACAISTVEVGLDIEYRCERDFVAIAGQFCSDAELRHLQSLSQAEQAVFFYEMWTLNEATFKLHGRTDSAVGDTVFCQFEPRAHYVAALAARNVGPIKVFLKMLRPDLTFHQRDEAIAGSET